MTTKAQLQERVEQLTALLRVGELALDYYRTSDAAAQAREAYHDEVRAFEATFAGGARVKVDPTNPMYTQRRAHTEEEFVALEAAKKKTYRAKRKLLKACMDFIEGGAK